MSTRSRKHQSTARKSLNAVPSAMGDKIRAAATVYEKAGQMERAEGMRQAAGMVDKHATGGPEDLLDYALIKVDEAIVDLQAIRHHQVMADVNGAHTAVAARTSTKRGSRQISALFNSLPRTPLATRDPPPAPRALTPPESKPGLTPCEAAVLRTLKARSCGTDKKQVAVMTGYRVKSGSFNKAFTDLKAAGYIDTEPGGRYIITEVGSAFIGDVPKLPTGRQAIDFWRDKLGPCHGAVLLVMFEAYPSPVDKNDLANRAGQIVNGEAYSSGSGSFNKALTDLRKVELVEGYRLSRTLMET